MSGARFLDQPPDDTDRVHELWCWVGIHANGGEGILAGGLEGLGYVPLITGSAATAEKMRAMAREIQRESMHRADRFVRLELRRYVLDSKAEG